MTVNDSYLNLRTCNSGYSNALKEDKGNAELDEARDGGAKCHQCSSRSYGYWHGKAVCKMHYNMMLDVAMKYGKGGN
jgi:hypothetical protein